MTKNQTSPANPHCFASWQPAQQGFIRAKRRGCTAGCWLRVRWQPQPGSVTRLCGSALPPLWLPLLAATLSLDHNQRS